MPSSALPFGAALRIASGREETQGVHPSRRSSLPRNLCARFRPRHAARSPDGEPSGAIVPASPTTGGESANSGPQLAYSEFSQMIENEPPPARERPGTAARRVDVDTRIHTWKHGAAISQARFSARRRSLLRHPPPSALSRRGIVWRTANFPRTPFRLISRDACSLSPFPTCARWDRSTRKLYPLAAGRDGPDYRLHVAA